MAPPPQVKKPWADGPFELIPASKLGFKKGEPIKGSKVGTIEMLTIHNFIIRGLNSIYLQAVNVERSPKDVPAFVEYAYTWACTIHHHHSLEERIVFPSIEEVTGEKGIMEANVAQHHAFETGLDKYQEYLKAVKGGKETYSGVKLRELINSFMPVLRGHLSDEIDTLRGLSKYEEKVDWDKWWKVTIAKVIKDEGEQDPKTISIPFVIRCHDKTWEDGLTAFWPPVPWIVLTVFNWLYFGKHKDWWQFSPCDTSGKPRDMPFAE